MQFIISVTVLASVYALLATGFICVYRSSRVLNFAYGPVFMLLGYLTVAAMKLFQTLPLLPFVLVLLLSFILGLFIYQFFIRAMAGKSIMSTILLTVALGTVLEATTVFLWGGTTETIPFFWRAYITIPGGRISSVEVMTLCATAVLFTALLLFYRFSKYGQQMRATAENPLLAGQRGINIHLVTGLSWGIATFATGLAAIISGSNYWVNTNMGHVAIKAFAVAVLGGLDSLPGALPAALAVALLETLTNTVIDPRLADAVPFIIMLIVLFVRPWGLFGTAEEIERV